MGISLSCKVSASTQYLKGYLADLQNACFYAVSEWVSRWITNCWLLRSTWMGVSLSYKLLSSTQYLNGYLTELQNACFYAISEWVSHWVANACFYAVSEWVSRWVTNCWLLRSTWMVISLSWRMPASTQYLNEYLTELQIAGLYAVPKWVSRWVTNCCPLCST